MMKINILDRKFKNFVFSLFVLFGSAGCAYLGYLKDPFVDIPNFYQVDKALYRGGQPNKEGMRRLKDTGIKTIINLRNPDEELMAEKELAAALGIDFVNIPLSIYRIPSDEQVLEFLSIVTDEEKQPIFVHCESGRDRTGAMVAVYRVVVSGWTIKQAYKEAKRKGFWPYRGNACLKKFIHQLKDKDIFFESVGRHLP